MWWSGGLLYRVSFNQHEEALIHKQYVERITDQKTSFKQYEINKK